MNNTLKLGAATLLGFSIAACAEVEPAEETVETTVEVEAPEMPEAPTEGETE